MPKVTAKKKTGSAKKAAARKSLSGQRKTATAKKTVNGVLLSPAASSTSGINYYASLGTAERQSALADLRAQAKKNRNGSGR
jgi:hypothetical protein